MKNRVRFLALALTVAIHAVWADGAAEPVDLTLPQLGGGEISLQEMREQWVVLNYWATWCAPCRKEIPDLSALHERHADLTVLGLAFEDVEPEAFQVFLEDIPASYPIVMVDVYNPPEPFGAPRVLPTTILIEPGGRPVKTWVGPVTGEMIEAFIDGAGQP